MKCKAHLEKGGKCQRILDFCATGREVGKVSSLPVNRKTDGYGNGISTNEYFL
jgi:hypothetical protein